MFYKLFKYACLLNLISIINSFVTNSNILIQKEQKIFSDILNSQNLPCHLQSVRVKSFNSAMQKMELLKAKDIYDLYDLIGFRYVFYTKEDLLKFYHHIKLEKTIWYSKNYINKPKKNGYSAFHIRYKNEFDECPIKQLECQLYVISDYYNSLYGLSRYDKNYTLLY